MGTANITLTETQFQKLRKLIYDRSGIFFADNKKYILESRLARRLEELEIENFDQYVQFLSIGPYREDEFQEMFNRITINETSFFRNEPQLQVFERKILNTLFETRKATRRLRIWSAACSTGEEPYTIAMLVHRTLGLRLGDWNIEILGTDISEKALLTAQSGKYPSYAIRTTDPLVLKRYFTASTGFYQVIPEVMKMVSFETLNLKDGFAAKRHGAWDVVFCRNCMIYFDQSMRDQVVQLFYDVLTPDGSLLIGHSETLQNCPLFEAYPEPHAFAYQRASPGRRTAARTLADGSSNPVLRAAGIKV